MGERSRERTILALVMAALAILGAVAFLRQHFPILASNREEVDGDFHAILLIVGPTFILVQFLLAYFVWRYPAKMPGPASAVTSMPSLTWSWFALLLVLEGFLVAKDVHAWTAITGPAPENALVVEVTGQQFQWNFRYPGSDGIFGRTNARLTSDSNPLGLDPSDPAGKDDLVTQDLFYLPLGKPVRLVIKSKDMIHSFFLPNFRIKQDAVPGLSIETSFTPTRTGNYPIACAQFCGLGHYAMHGTLEVLTPQAYQNKLKELKEGAKE